MLGDQLLSSERSQAGEVLQGGRSIMSCEVEGEEPSRGGYEDNAEGAVGFCRRVVSISNLPMELGSKSSGIIKAAAEDLGLS